MQKAKQKIQQLEAVLAANTSSTANAGWYIVGERLGGGFGDACERVQTLIEWEREAAAAGYSLVVIRYDG